MKCQNGNASEIFHKSGELNGNLTVPTARRAKNVIHKLAWDLGIPLKEKKCKYWYMR